MLALFTTYYLYNKVKMQPMITLEAGSNLPSAQSFVMKARKEPVFAKGMPSIDTAVPGEYEVMIDIGKKTYESKLVIEDTIAPQGKLRDVQIWSGEELLVSDFVEEISDITETTSYFIDNPDNAEGGIKTVKIGIKDAGGNETVLEAKLEVLVDTTPPQIEGTADIKAYIGDTVSYRKGVSVSDNHDNSVSLEIDSSKVDLKNEGVYEVIYSATDASGNTASKAIKVTVTEKPFTVTEAMINDLADKVLAKIIKPGMTDKQKLRAIFDYSLNHITYTGDSDKSDWLKGAYRGFVKANGDCFNYYSTARALLTRAGFPNMPVTRVAGTPTRHYWSLVYFEGAWYHFDTTPHRRGYPFECFLKTDAQVADYTKQVKYYYLFDSSKYPATPTTPIN